MHMRACIACKHRTFARRQSCAMHSHRVSGSCVRVLSALTCGIGTCDCDRRPESGDSVESVTCIVTVSSVSLSEASYVSYPPETACYQGFSHLTRPRNRGTQHTAPCRRRLYSIMRCYTKRPDVTKTQVRSRFLNHNQHINCCRAVSLWRSRSNKILIHDSHRPTRTVGEHNKHQTSLVSRLSMF